MGVGHDKRGRADGRGVRGGPVGRLDANVGVCAATHSMDRATDRSNERSLGMAIIIAFATLSSPLLLPTPVNAIVPPVEFLVWFW